MVDYKLFLEMYRKNESVDDPEIKPLFYDGNSKCVIGIYKLISRDDNITKILNIQELEAYGNMLPFTRGEGKLYYADNKMSGYSIKRVIELPTKKIHLLREFENGYCELSIPYYIYKPLIKKLKILKLDKSLYRIVDKTHRIDDLEKYI